MVRVEFPKPTGHPQLVVTHKQAFILDAHIQDKVILSVKAPKEGSICGNPPVSVKAGHWTLRLNGSIVHCFYSDDCARGIWRAELAPKGSDAKTVISLSSGFTTNGVSAEHLFFMCLCVFITLAVGFVTYDSLDRHIRESRLEFTALANGINSLSSMIFDSLDDFKKTVPAKEETPPNDYAGPRAGYGPVGLQGPKGETAKGAKLDTLYDLLTFSLRAKFPDRFEEASTTFPYLKEFLDNFEPREGDTPKKEEKDFIVVEGSGIQIDPKEEEEDYIIHTETFKPGMELLNTQTYKIGYFTLGHRFCSIQIFEAAIRSIRSYEGKAIGSVGYEHRCVLSMQRDGNLVMYHPEKGALWSSKDEIGKLCPKGITLTQNKGKIVCQE